MQVLLQHPIPANPGVLPDLIAVPSGTIGDQFGPESKGQMGKATSGKSNAEKHEIASSSRNSLGLHRDARDELNLSGKRLRNSICLGVSSERIMS